MSNAIQLAFDQGQSGQTLPATPAPWAAGASAPRRRRAGAPETTPFTKVHRLLRGRYLLAFVLALLGRRWGGGGFFSQKPAYKSEVTLEFDPIIRKSEDTEKVMVMFQTYIAGQMLKMQNERVLRAAMLDPRWKAVRPGSNPDADLATFAENVKITLPPKSPTFVVVSYSDTAPDAKKVAPIAAACIVDAFLEIYGREDPRGLQQRINHWQNEVLARANLEIQRRRSEIETLSKNGEDDAMMIRAHDEELIRVQTELRGFAETLAAAETDLAALTQNPGAKPTVEDWARVDVTMEGHVKLRNELMLRVDSLSAQLGPNHRATIASRQDLETRQAYMNKYAETLNQQFVIRWSPDGSGGKPIPRNLDGLRKSVERLRELQERESKKVTQMRYNASQIATAKQEITQLGFKVTEALENLRELNFQKENVGQAKVLSVDDAGRPMGTMPVPDKDRRPLFAAAGFLGGAGLPIGLLMLIGLLDSRYRYSDETAGGPATSGLNLLGILPNLPDRLSDPEQAAIAAHCVHQIRTMLQINHAADGRERRVFAVTSASPGDGKTSLTLRLASATPHAAPHAADRLRPDRRRAHEPDERRLGRGRAGGDRQPQPAPVRAPDRHRRRRPAPGRVGRQPARVDAVAAGVAPADRGGREALRDDPDRHRPDPGQHRGEPGVRRGRRGHPGGQSRAAAPDGREVAQPPGRDRREAGGRGLQPRTGPRLRAQHQRRVDAVGRHPRPPRQHPRRPARPGRPRRRRQERAGG
jgi:uncharacterized protein involved in exopolysaccharide biosynthesis